MRPATRSLQMVPVVGDSLYFPSIFVNDDHYKILRVSPECYALNSRDKVNAHDCDLRQPAHSHSGARGRRPS